MPLMPMRRKKWTEEEEEALISTYGELLQSGFLSKAKSRERKFHPMAAHVNALFHAQNPVAYPWLWSWKDASTKVQNMRHQYLGVKQKIKKVAVPSTHPTAQREEYEWREGICIWANFLKYRAVFGDQDVDASECSTPQASADLAHCLQHHCPLPNMQSEHEQFAPHLKQQLSDTQSPALPFSHSISFPSESNDCGIHSLAKCFSNAASGMTNSNVGLLLQDSKDPASAVCGQVLLEEEPDRLASSLAFEYHQEGQGDSDSDEDSLKDREEECAEPLNKSLGLHVPKRQRQSGGFDIRLCINSCDARLCTFFDREFLEFRQREARREEREAEHEREMEARLALLHAERLKQMQDWQRERASIVEARRRDTERWQAELQEQKLQYKVMEEQCEILETERQQEKSEKMKHERMQWQEKTESRAMQHQAAMMQMQLQISQCLQNALTFVGGTIACLSGGGNDDIGQPSPGNLFLSQILQNLQTSGMGTMHDADRRGTGESSDNHFDVNGDG